MAIIIKRVCFICESEELWFLAVVWADHLENTIQPFSMGKYWFGTGQVWWTPEWITCPTNKQRNLSLTVFRFSQQSLIWSSSDFVVVLLRTQGSAVLMVEFLGWVVLEGASKISFSTCYLTFGEKWTQINTIKNVTINSDVIRDVLSEVVYHLRSGSEL